MKMSLISRLHKYLFIPILEEWLSATDLGELDSALCNKHDRSMFLNAISQYPKSFENKFALGTTMLSSSLFDWMSARQFEGKLMQRVCITNEFINAMSNDDRGRIKSSLFAMISRVQHIEMLRCSPDHVKSLGNIVQNAKQVLSLCLTDCYQVDTVLAPSYTNMSHLTTCNLTGSTGPSSNALIQMLRSCSKLTDLNLKGCDWLSESLFYAIVVHGRRLTALNLKYVEEAPSENILLMCLMHNTGTRRLKTFTCLQQTDLTVSTLLAYHGQSLVSLNLGYVDNINDEALSCLGEYNYCPVITKLSLKNSAHITNELLNQKLIQMPHLSSLNLQLVRGLTNDVLCTVIYNCRGLRELFLSSNVHIDALTLQKLSVSCTTLESLCLSNIPALSASLLKAIMSSNASLTLLDISSNLQVVDSWFTTCCGQCVHLRTLCLMQCSNISSASLLALARHCHQLTDLDLFGCTALTDEGLSRIIATNRHLTRLDVTHCLNLTDLTLQCLISQPCRRLTSLSVRNCHLMSPRCLHRLVMTLPRLRDLFVGQHQLDNSAKLRKTNPDLSVDIFY